MGNPKLYESNIWRNIWIFLLFLVTLLLSVLLLENFLNSRLNYDDSICKFVTFGKDRPTHLRNSTYWAQTEDELKLICKLGDDVYIYNIGSRPRLKRSIDESDLVENGQNSTVNLVPSLNKNDTLSKSAKKLPLLVISSQDISTNLLSTLKLQFEDEIWLFTWREEVCVLRSWNIFAKNVDSLTENKIKLHDRILKTLVQILNTIITEECYRQIGSGKNICSKIDLASKLRTKIVKPLLKSYIADGMACVDVKFYIDHLKIRNGTNIGKILKANLAELEQGKPIEIVVFSIKLCH